MNSKERIAVYGLGIETKKELPQLSKKYNIVGLLDGFKTDGEMYGYSVMSINKAFDEDIKKIIVVARPGSCKAIAKRIGEICREHKVNLYDIRGKNLLLDNTVVYDFASVKGYSYTDIISTIESADVISFDLFDTLIIRTVMSHTDVIALVFARLKEKGILIENFVNRRIAAEKQLSLDKSPRLTEIYTAAFGNENGINIQEIVDIEYNVDRELLVPRKAVVELINKAHEKKKKLYITTDMYYSKEQIIEIMDDCGIKAVDDVLVSCEYNTGKTGELFERLKMTAASENILHIGDDIISDIKSAIEHGIKAFQIFSGGELFDLVGGMGLLKHTDNLSDRIKIGMFISDIFNSPFRFEDVERKITANDAFDVGWLFCAPMICDFVQWFGEEIKSRGLKNVWFCARDGYLIQKLFEKYYPNIISDYYLTSRISSIRSGVENESDVAYVDSMNFSGSTEDNLFTRFGLCADKIDESLTDYSKNGLQRYTKAILKAAKVKKKNNLKYIQQLKPADGDIAFFDFVAKGTNQMYAERLVSNKFTGLYFLQPEPEFMTDKKLNIITFYEESERALSSIFNNYYILETLLTSPSPSVNEFDEEGRPIYGKETRTLRDIKCLLRAQNGILSYGERYLRICPVAERRINKRLDEDLLNMLHNVKIQDKDFLGLTVEDPFFNRMTDITDVL